MRNFNHSINVLVKAYLNNTLQHGNCTACAVGNLIAEAADYSYGLRQFTKNWLKWNEGSPDWQMVFMTDQDGRQNINPLSHVGIAKRQIDSTGYTWQELAKIEFAFETAPKGINSDDHMFNGLMAVVDVLAEIHQVDLSVKEESKKLFVHANL